MRCFSPSVIGVAAIFATLSVQTDAASSKATAAEQTVLQLAAESPRVDVGIPRLTRSRLRPSVLRVDVPMTSNGAAVSRTSGRFSFVRCTARMLQDPGYAKKRALGHPGYASTGSVGCGIFFNNAQYRGMTLAGEIHLRVAGKPVVRKFSVRLGAGSSLSAPVGAIIDAKDEKKQPPAATTEWRGTLHLVEARGTPGVPPGYSSLDIRLTLLPGATKTDALGWTQPVSWVATYSSEGYSDPPCTDRAGNPVPSDLGERTVVRGRTGERPASNAKDHPRIGVRWDPARTKWEVSLSFFGGGGGGMRLPLVVKTTKNCGKSWVTFTSTPFLQNMKVRADGTATSTALRGQGTPSGFYNENDTTVTWDLTLTRSG